MTYAPLAPFEATSGPHDARLLLIGEAWGRTEDELHKPFVGESGKLLFQMLGEAIPLEQPLMAEAIAQMNYGHRWIAKRDEWLSSVGIAMTNVLALRPPDNKLDQLCMSKKDLLAIDPRSAARPISQGKYLHPLLAPELDRLKAEIESIRPNVIVALGNTACWAVLNATNIGSIRGTVTKSPLGVKTIATYHPAGVMRNWSWRPIVVADLMKAGREMAYSDVRRPSRSILYNPSIGDIEQWATGALNDAPLLSIDTETAKGQITCIGFARSRSDALVIPFANQLGTTSYWQTQADEERAWRWVHRLLTSPVPKLFQNGLYDIQYLRRMGLNVVNAQDDAMILHHAIFPELQKSLGFLGSIYTNEPAWKLMRMRKADTEKRDE